MATLATRLTETGNLFVNGTFDEVSMPSGSLYFDGTGDHIRTPTNSAFDLSLGDFTIEFFAYFTSVAAGQHILVNYTNPGGSYGLAIYTTSNGTLNYYLGSLGYLWNIANAVLIGNIVTGIWYHVALVRSGSTFTPYLNGVAGNTSISASSLYNNSLFNIGGDGSNNANVSFFGYMSNFRIVKGTALYTANFTPSIGILESTANTSLLLNVLNSTDYIKDNSPNKFSITRNGDTAYNSLSPFNRGAHSVSNDTVFTKFSDEVSLAAGSLYFDGTGDNLTVANTSALSLGSGNFTIDFWINSPTPSGNACIIETRSVGGVAGYFVAVTVNNLIQFNYVSNYYSVGTVVPNAWNHVAIVRSGSTVRTFINGIAESGTFTTSATITANSASIGQKVYSPSTLINLTGYLSNLRVINGSALYSANFIPQQSILESTADTSYLLNVLNSADALKDSSNSRNITTAGGDTAWNANGPFNQGVTRLAERRLNDATLVKGQFDEMTGAPIVDSSLIFWADPGQPNSYPGTGTTLTDLAGNRAGTLTNGPIYSPLNLGYIIYDSTNDYVTFGDVKIAEQTNKTVTAWIFLTGTPSAVVGIIDKEYDVAPNYGGWGLWAGPITGGTGLWFWVHPNKDKKDTTVLALNRWYNVGITWNTTAKTVNFFVNGSQTSTFTDATITENASNTVPFTLGTIRGASVTFGGGSSNYFPGYISSTMVYNRELSADEISQNFNALRRRFSI